MLRTPVFAFRAAGQGDSSTFVLRTPVFALRAAGQGDSSTFVLRTPVFAFRAAGQAHASSPMHNRNRSRLRRTHAFTVPRGLASRSARSAWVKPSK